MKFSLIMATVNRKQEVENFIKSLLVQTYTDFELIIVDQNSDDRVSALYSEYKDKITIKYIHSSRKGLSVNRNVGLAHYSGSIIAFPDDDCEYESDTLEKINYFFENNQQYSFYTCNTKEKKTEGTIFKARTTDADISIFNFMSVGISYTIFIRTAAFNSFRFDEQMGVGAAFSSGEESDLLLFLLKASCKGRYHTSHYIYHPAKEETSEKAFLYGKGFGAVYKKAVTIYKFPILMFTFMLRILKGTINVIVFRDKKTRFASLRGRILGFIQYTAK